MVNNVTCPVCGKQCTPSPTPGPDMRCPSCFSVFAIKPAAVSPLLERSSATTPAPALAPVNRTILAQPEAMIRYSCPRCKKSLESPASFAGQKLNCPECNQRLQIPQPSTPSPPPAVNKTILATEEPPAVPPTRTPRQSPPAMPEVELVVEAVPAARRESCLECGADITRRARVQTCPDCGSLFCSAGCYRDHHYHAHAQKAKKRSRPVECSHCGSTERPYAHTQISQAGWITFVLLLIFFFPLFWIGLLMTETEWRCRDCGRLLD
jgi:DNA-directed RNA polymerase subunit RPC12/RpoP